MAQSDIKAQITNAQGQVKEFRNSLHAWGALNPFSLATVALVVGLAIGIFLF